MSGCIWEGIDPSRNKDTGNSNKEDEKVLMTLVILAIVVLVIFAFST